MNRTPIEWAKNPDGSLGYTWNPITGCLNHTGGLCKGGDFPCYAYRLVWGRLKQRYLHGRGWKINYDPSKDGYREACLDPFYPRFWEERLSDIPQNWKPLSVKPRGIFVCDMSDLFGVGIPDEWTARVMEQIKLHPEHRFYLLTKQPQNLLRWSPFSDNCYVGVTATNADMCIRAGYCLSRIEAKVKFLSLEPLLDWQYGKPGFIATMLQSWGINWLIIGAQTNPYKPPKIEWVQEIVEAADKAGIPVFLKDNLQPLFEADTKLHGFRQEMPEEVKQCKEF